MSETPNTPAAPTEAPKPTPTPAPVETDWKAESRKWEARSKENSAAAARLAELEEAAKSEAQKQAEALAAAHARVKEFEAREQVATWKAEVAQATGVPVAALAGSTRDEIEAHATTLKPLIAAAQRPSSTALANVNSGAAPLLDTTPGMGTLRAAYAKTDKE